MANNMAMERLPLLAKVQRNNVQRGSNKSKMYLLLYAIKPFILRKLQQKVNQQFMSFYILTK